MAAKKKAGKVKGRLGAARGREKKPSKKITREEAAARTTYEMREMTRGAEQLSLRYRLPAGLEKELDKMSWETVANLANTFKLKIEGENIQLRKLEKEMELTRLIVLERISHHQKTGAFDYKFFVDLVKLLERCEKLAIQHEVDLDEFLLFVYILIEKMKRERLVVYSPKEMSYRKPASPGEFCRLKEQENFGSGLP